MFEAVVLAGGGKPDLLAAQEGVSNKVFIKLKGRPLLAYILQALVEAPSISRTVVVGPSKELQELRLTGLEFDIVAELESMLDNLAAGFEAVERDRLCLVVTGDIPLLSAAVIEDFIKLCAPYDQDFYFPILSRETCMREYPENVRTYVRLKEGHITGGNIVLLRPGWFLENRARLEMFISYRKKPLKLIKIMPVSFVFKYLFKKLSTVDLEQYLSGLLKFKAKAVPCESVEISIDVDKPSDLELVKKAML